MTGVDSEPPFPPSFGWNPGGSAVAGGRAPPPGPGIGPGIGPPIAPGPGIPTNGVGVGVGVGVIIPTGTIADGGSIGGVAGRRTGAG